MRGTEERETVIPTEAMTLVHYPLLKLYDTTRLLKPGEYNDQAVAILIECHKTIVGQIPGAVSDISFDNQAAQSAQSNAAYKNQIRQGQTIFSAPGEGPTSTESNDLAETRNNTFK